jgi:hypothetical protein
MGQKAVNKELSRVKTKSKGKDPQIERGKSIYKEKTFEKAKPVEIIVMISYCVFFMLYVILSIWVFIDFPFFHLNFFLIIFIYLFFIIIFLFFGYLILKFILLTVAHMYSDNLEIYEKGILVPQRSNLQILREKHEFIHFDSIKSIYFNIPNKVAEKLVLNDKKIMKKFYWYDLFFGSSKKDFVRNYVLGFKKSMIIVQNNNYYALPKKMIVNIKKFKKVLWNQMEMKEAIILS